MSSSVTLLMCLLLCADPPAYLILTAGEEAEQNVILATEFEVGDWVEYLWPLGRRSTPPQVWNGCVERIDKLSR